jgi:hypothetical protein
MKPVTPLNYDKDVSFEGASRYGKYFHVATLKDGRSVGFSADKVLVTATGDLLAMSTSYFSLMSEERKETTEAKTILCLAAGEWLSFYAASVSDGDPVGIDWVEGHASKKS